MTTGLETEQLRQESTSGPDSCLSGEQVFAFFIWN